MAKHQGENPYLYGLHDKGGQEHLVFNGEARGWAMDRDGQFEADRAAEPAIDRTALEALISSANQYLTFTCTPWGSGVRVGIDRNLDGILDGDE